MKDITEMKENSLETGYQGNSEMRSGQRTGEIPTLLTVEEVAAQLRIGRNSAYNLVKSGQIKSIKIGRTIRIPKMAVLEYIGLS